MINWSFFIIKLGFRRGIGVLFFIIAGLLVLGAWFDLVYEKTTSFVIAIILAIIAFFLVGKKKDSLSSYDYSRYTPRYNPPRQSTWSKWSDRRRQLAEVRHQQNLDYQRQRLAQENARRLQQEAERKRIEER